MGFFLIVAAISFVIVFPYIAIVILLVALCVAPFYLLYLFYHRSNYAGYWAVGFLVILMICLGIASAPPSAPIKVAQQDIVAYQPTVADCANSHLHVSYYAGCKAIGY